jgi:hypothetical protein
LTQDFDWYRLRREHRLLIEDVLGGAADKGGLVQAFARPPDLVIAPDGEPYLYRWHVIPRNSLANVYLHIQVADDPERPLHDHPWDNQSVILVGGYDELYVCNDAWGSPVNTRRVREGDTVHRKAEDAHRLLLASPLGYTISLFSTGSKRREWGFWFPDGWRNQREVIENLPDGRSIFKAPANA